jgi:chemotaxis protein MotB
MLRKLSVPGIAIVLVLIVASCSTGKKLQATEEQLKHLEEQNRKLSNDLTQLEKDATDLNNRYKSLMADYNSYKEECEETKEKLAMWKEILAEEMATLEKVEEKLHEALENFNDKGVDVYSKGGLLHVSLSDDLLYKTGSAKLGDDGKQALASLASVLNDYPKLKVIVLGNTDDIQFKKGTDNWSLSTERANGVVRLLRDSYKVDPSRLTAAGKAKYNPVADNSTAEGRAKNRRTDIILNPDLERLWSSAKKDRE